MLEEGTMFRGSNAGDTCTTGISGDGGGALDGEAGVKQKWGRG